MSDNSAAHRIFQTEWLHRLQVRYPWFGGYASAPFAFAIGRAYGANRLTWLSQLPPLLAAANSIFFLARYCRALATLHSDLLQYPDLMYPRNFSSPQCLHSIFSRGQDSACNLYSHNFPVQSQESRSRIFLCSFEFDGSFSFVSSSRKVSSRLCWLMHLICRLSMRFFIIGVWDLEMPLPMSCRQVGHEFDLGASVSR